MEFEQPMFSVLLILANHKILVDRLVRFAEIYIQCKASQTFLRDFSRDNASNPSQAQYLKLNIKVISFYHLSTLAFCSSCYFNICNTETK